MNEQELKDLMVLSSVNVDFFRIDIPSLRLIVVIKMKEKLQLLIQKLKLKFKGMNG
jgi:hypothetical protein